MSAKHKIKLFVREAWARTLFHTGLHALVNAIQPPRLTILAGHCVTAPSNAKLPRDMKIEAAKLEQILTWLARHYDVVTMDEAWTRLEAGTKKSLAVLTMDDGYVDNRTHLLPLLERCQVSATIYLESRALDERRANWSHKFFAVLDHMSAEDFVLRFTELSKDTRSNILLNQLASRDEMTSYHVKRLLKYDVPASERARVVDLMFQEVGGDDRALTDELYMTWDDARALRDARVELGGHTMNHEILSKLDLETARREVAGCRASIARALGTEPASFAYPFGRRWDWNDESARVVKEAGFRTSTSTHAGTNKRGDDAYRLKRLMIEEDAKLHLIATEACGGFDFLRRFGLDLSE